MATAQPQVRHLIEPPVSAALPTFGLARPMARVRKENPDWDEKRLEAAEAAYRDFLKECKTVSGPISPTGDVDEVWHAHILHTRQYAEDCSTYCGFFIHHNPLDKVGECDADSCCRPCESDPSEIGYH